MYSQIQSWPSAKIWEGKANPVRDLAELTPIGYSMAAVLALQGFIQTQSEQASNSVYSLFSCQVFSGLIDAVSDDAKSTYSLFSCAITLSPFNETATDAAQAQYSLASTLVRQAFNQTFSESNSVNYSLVSCVV